MRSVLRLLLVPTVLCVASLAHAAVDPAIAFLKGNRLCVMNANGTNQTVLTSFNVGRPAYSPDGQWLAFEATYGAPQGFGVYVIRVDGTGLRKVVSKVWDSLLYGVDWAVTPDGVERIAFTDRPVQGQPLSLFVTDLQGLDVIQLTVGMSDASPSFSRTGDTLYSCQGTDLVRLDLGLVGGELAVVQSTSLVYDLPSSPLQGWSVMSVRAATNSDRLVVNAWDLNGSFQNDLWVIDPANPSGAVNLTASFSEACVSPTWSPDGSRIAFHTQLSKRTTIAQIPSTGGTITNLSGNTTKTAHMHPAWRRQP